MNARLNLMAALAAATLLWTATPARAQEPQALVTGAKAERALGPSENHVYPITLQNGAAVIGQADQHGIDLVIDISGPDGKLVRTVDSPNGTIAPLITPMRSATSCPNQDRIGSRRIGKHPRHGR